VSGEEVMRRRRCIPRGRALCLLALCLALASPPPASAHDVPNKIVMQGFIRPEGDRLHVALRVPLIMLLNVDMPKRGPGYLDLDRIDDLGDAEEATSGGVRIFQGDRHLNPVGIESQISKPSDESFVSYEDALQHVRGPLPRSDTKIYWNQGFFDVHFEYPAGSDDADFALELELPPELGSRTELALQFIDSEGVERAYRVTEGSGRVVLDPRWYQAAWTFVKSGFVHILGGLDHLLFLLCLVIPFRRIGPLLPIVTSFTVAHSATLIASTYGLVPQGEWFPPLVEMLIAASIVYMAIENVFAANLKRRWAFAGVFGLVHGLGFSYGLQESFQFAGDHMLVSLASFNLGVEAGQVLVLVLVVPVLLVLLSDRLLGRVGVVILSVLVAHTTWHWTVDRARVLTEVPWPALDADFVSTMARLMFAALLIGGGLWLISKYRRQPGPERIPLKWDAFSSSADLSDRANGNGARRKTTQR
jgi:hydrogenase/urease accessory protein HupE